MYNHKPSYPFHMVTKLLNPTPHVESLCNGMSSQSSPDVASHEPATYVLSGTCDHLILTIYKEEPKTYFHPGKAEFLSSAPTDILA